MPMIPATPQHEAFYQECLDAINSVARKHPDINDIELLAVLARATGYAAAAFGADPEVRNMSYTMVIQNIERGVISWDAKHKNQRRH